jgi:hypothetical protein
MLVAQTVLHNSYSFFVFQDHVIGLNSSGFVAQKGRICFVAKRKERFTPGDEAAP